MSKLKIRFIINPISGKKHKEHLPQQIEEHLDHSKFDHEICISQYAGHATILAKDAINQHFDILAVAGGDGSINEVGTPLIGTNMALAIIPCGSGNGLSRCMNIPLDPIKALQIINNNQYRKIDTVTVNGQSFISISGTGYDAKVAEDYSKDPRRGFETYFRYIVRNYITMKEQPYTIIMPDETLQIKAFFISFANSNQMGYDFPISPHASLWDGKVDLCIVQKPNPLELPIIGGYMIDGMMDKAPKVKIIQTPEATIIRPKADVINLDGESIMMEKDLHLKVNPLSLNIICNETQK
ncbi:MAG: diacylglycerol kinase family lipid kinase [Bacteroidales bacterium]|nr:diacylglycerol kinase family lipid kinase [Bacteroidales bacterium]